MVIKEEIFLDYQGANPWFLPRRSFLVTKTEILLSFLVSKKEIVLGYQKGYPSCLPRRRSFLVTKKEILLACQERERRGHGVDSEFVISFLIITRADRGL